MRLRRACRLRGKQRKHLHVGFFELTCLWHNFIHSQHPNEVAMIEHGHLNGGRERHIRQAMFPFLIVVHNQRLARLDDPSCHPFAHRDDITHIARRTLAYYQPQMILRPVE